MRNGSGTFQKHGVVNTDVGEYIALRRPMVPPLQLFLYVQYVDNVPLFGKLCVVELCHSVWEGGGRHAAERSICAADRQNIVTMLSISAYLFICLSAGLLVCPAYLPRSFDGRPDCIFVGLSAYPSSLLTPLHSNLPVSLSVYLSVCFMHPLSLCHPCPSVPHFPSPAFRLSP